jgi:RNA polymerase sigma-70 factor (ECF subfamily)
MSEETLREILEKTSAERLSQWRGYALSLTRNPADADEVVQEAIARTLKAQPDLDSEERVNRYVLRAIRNRAFTLIGKRKPLADLDKAEHRLPKASSALDVMLDNENEEARKHLGQALKSRIKELRPEHREVIEKLVMRTPPLKLREVAATQGVSINTVHYRLRRALAALHDMIEDDGTLEELEAGRR